MAKTRVKFKTFVNPSGIIELCYFGNQSPESSIAALESLEKLAKTVEKRGQPVLILADVTRIPKIDMSRRTTPVRKKALEMARTLKIKRAAVYGPLMIQIIVNTIALIAGKQHKIRVFGDRVKAIKWLKQGKV